MYKSQGTVGASVHYQVSVFCSGQEDSACISFPVMCSQAGHRATGGALDGSPCGGKQLHRGVLGEMSKFAKGLMTSAKRPCREEGPRTGGCGEGGGDGTGKEDGVP